MIGNSCPRIEQLPSPESDKRGWPWTEGSLSPGSTMPGGDQWPRISVVTPSYNQGQFIEETIRSVLLQGYPNLEYIIMDGGSMDGSAEIIRRYEPWLGYVRIGPDAGQAAAIAEGFERATGDILAWLNSDDCYQPGTLARVARFFTIHPAVVFGHGDLNYIDVTSRLVKRLYTVHTPRFLVVNLGVHRWFQPSCFWQRSAYLQVGEINPSLQFCMDRDLFIRLTDVGLSRRIIGPPLADFRQHENAKSQIILDVNARENSWLISQYSSPAGRKLARLLKWIWLLWLRCPVARERLNQAFGWEW